MPVLASLTTFSAGLILRSEHNANWAALRTWADNSVVHTDVAKTITVTHTFSAAQTFSSTINGQTISAAANFTGTLAVTGNVTTAAQVTHNLGGSSQVDFSGASPGDLVVNRWYNTSASALQRGILQQAFVGATWIGEHGWRSDTNATPAASSWTLQTMVGSVVAERIGVTTSGNTTVTGNATVTGNLTVTGTFSAPGVVTATALASDATTTSVTPANTALAVALGSNQTWRIDFEMSVQCDNTGGVVLNFTAPAGATCQGTWIGNTSSHTAVYGRSVNSFASVQAWSSFNSSASTNGVMVRASLYVTTTATSGNLTLQISSGVAGQTSKLLSGSTTLSTRIT